MKRKVQAQRKFAQGAFVPQHQSDRIETLPAKEPTENKRSEKDIIYNQMSPSRLLDYVSFRKLKIRDVRVRVERLQENFLNRVEPKRKPIVKPRKIIRIKKNANKRKKNQIRSSVMGLRSRSIKHIMSVKKRPNIQAPVVILPKKKRLGLVCAPTQPSVSGFSSDDDTPLNVIKQSVITTTAEVHNPKENYFLRKQVVASKGDPLLVSKVNNISSSKKNITKTKDNTGKEDTAKNSPEANEPERPLCRIVAVTSQAFYNNNEIERWIVGGSNSSQKPKETFKVPPIPLPKRVLRDGVAAAAASASAAAVASSSSQTQGAALTPTVGNTFDVMVDVAVETISESGSVTMSVPSLVSSRTEPLLYPIPERASSPCPSVQFSTVESVQNATQKDFDSCCKKCHHCVDMNNAYNFISRNIVRMQEVHPEDELSMRVGVDGDAGSTVDAPAAKSTDVYNFDETDSVKERPTLTKFREEKQKNTSSTNKRPTRKKQLYVDLFSRNGSQCIRFKMPNGPEPIMKVSLLKNTNKKPTPKPVEQKAASSSQTLHIDSANKINNKSSKKEAPKSKSTNKKTRAQTSSGDKDTSDIPKSPTKILEAPVLYPTEKEFENPLAYIQKITPGASKFGMCKIVPPKPHQKPECQFEENTRFEVTNQYPGRMFTRWGPATREFCAIRSHLETENIQFNRPPLIDSLEVDIPKLFHTVQANGGLSNVLEKKKWNKVAEEMGWEPKPSLAKRLDQLYVKFLVPYDTLSNRERLEIVTHVEMAWSKRYQKMLFRARNPLHKQRRELCLSASSDEEEEDEVGCVGGFDDCVVRGRSMNLATFKRVAQKAMQLHFSSLKREATLQEVLDKYWQLVLLGSEHVCVHAAAVDTGDQGYGFPKGKGDPFSKLPWNPKVLSNNPGSVLRSLGPVIGVTVPTLHLGMVFSTSCWHRDPHGLPWIEYMHEGPPKIWYGISEDQSDKLRAAVENLCPAFCQNKSIWLASDITMIPPNLLAEHNVALSTISQKPGEFVVIFPKAFSSSICTGFTISESVYYAPLSWLTTVQNDFQEVRDSCEPTMFSLAQLLLALADDARTPQSVLPPAFRALGDVVRQELDERKALQEKGCSSVISKSSSKKKNTAVNMRDASECEICRVTLYLSKVGGVLSKSSAHCVMHARMLLTHSEQAAEPGAVTVTCYYTEQELADAVERMRLRLIPAATTPAASVSASATAPATASASASAAAQTP